MRPSALVAVALLGLVAAAPAYAQESLEKVVVRNRLYNAAGRFELGVDVGFTLVNQLTSHTNLNLDLAYNLTDEFAIELMGGYALSSHTGLADEVANAVMLNPVNPASTNNGWPNVVDDMANLWQMQGNAMAGLRWAPIYGKLSLFEIPVHFQTYVWAGGGAGSFTRTSVVYCLQASGTTCNAWETENKVSWLASAAFGLRFFIFGGSSIKVEMRDYLWQDSYLVQIDRRIGQGSPGAPGGPTGTPSTTAGMTNQLFLNLGYTYTF